MDEFLNKFIYLGANLGINSKVDTYIDLEAFFIEMSMHYHSDNRTKQAILNWSYRYAKILSPSKIRRLLTTTNFNREVVDEIVYLLIDHKAVKPNWKILLSDQTIQPINFRPNENKYLKRNSFIIKNVPEICYRAEGRSQVIADILAYSQKCSFKSLYELAKNIHSPRNRVNESYSQLKSFGII